MVFMVDKEHNLAPTSSTPSHNKRRKGRKSSIREQLSQQRRKSRESKAQRLNLIRRDQTTKITRRTPER
jgi:hypothetical protein